MNFLRQIANYYAAKITSGIDLSDYTFVFPNRRAAMFMRKYLKECFPHTAFMPKLITITAFTQQLCESSLASTDELVFILYNSYKAVMTRKGRADQVKDFDDFIFWGNILLRDFSDVDAYMVDYKQLFKNIHDEQEIESNYLTQDQIEVAKILGDKRNLKTDMVNFWKHTHGADGKEPVEKFISMWEILTDLYDEYQSRLDAKSIAYSGMLSRQAAARVREMTADDFADRRFVFVGFYVLSTARTLIFRHLQKLDIAEFFWDTASPYLHNPSNKAGSFVMPLSSKFKMPDDFELEVISKTPKIDVYPISSNFGQAKAAVQILQQWAKDADCKVGSDNTAVIMPNESLLMPMLYTLPESIGDKGRHLTLNVAMSMKYSTTPFASLINSILIAQEHARKIRGTYHFFYKEVLEIVSHPYINTFAHEAAEKIKFLVTKGHLYNVSAEDIEKAAPELAFIFSPIDNLNDIDHAKTFLYSLIHHLDSLLPSSPKSAGEELTEPYERIILKAFQQAIQQTVELAKAYSIVMHEHTLLAMMRRMLGTLSIQFKGDPVEGLQLLGMQDSRCLDFDNLIILSLNERILPRRNDNPSFIPPMMRRAYNMPTDENEDIANSYIFYRLISRAKRIAMLYDSRTTDLADGEKSRYITQIELLYPHSITTRSVGMQASIGKSREVIIDKTPEVMAQLNRYRAGGDLNFSASTLKNYIGCPLNFYLSNVSGMRYEDFDPEYMDAASYGTILHKVAEDFYKSFRSSPDSRPLIKAKTLQAYFETPESRKALKNKLTEYALRAMNETYYNHKYTGRLNEIPGEGRVLAKVIAKYISLMIRCESRGEDFVFVEGEDNGGKKVHAWKINDDLTVNFRMSIDRVDQLDDAGEMLRFIDYKTGADELKANSIEDVFTNHKFGAIFQLLVYCLAYNELNGIDKGIKPMIYKISELGKYGITDIMIGPPNHKKPINDYRQFDGDPQDSLKDEIRERLEHIFTEIFDKDVPFTQTPELDNCKFCQFLDLCGRKPEDKY